jgi:hydrogenase maturation protease
VSVERKRSIFVLGYGNPGRQDDGLGPKAAEGIASLGLPFVSTDAAFQLNIEDAEAISGHDVVIFVDASVSAPEPFSFERLYPAGEVTFTSHSVSPGSILRLCTDHFGPAPEAYVMGIRGYSFEFEEEMTAAARGNLEKALSFLSDFLLKRLDGSRSEDFRPKIEPMSFK